MKWARPIVLPSAGPLHRLVSFAFDARLVAVFVADPLRRAIPYRPTAVWAPMVDDSAVFGITLLGLVLLCQQFVFRRSAGLSLLGLRLKSLDGGPARRVQFLARVSLLFAPLGLLFAVVRSDLIQMLGCAVFSITTLGMCAIGERRHFADRLSGIAPQAEGTKARFAIVAVLLFLLWLAPFRSLHKFLGPDLWGAASADRNGYRAMELHAYRNAIMNFHAAQRADPNDLASYGGICAALAFLGPPADARAACDEAFRRGATGGALGLAVIAAESDQAADARRYAAIVLRTLPGNALSMRIAEAFASDDARVSAPSGLYTMRIPPGLPLVSGDPGAFTMRGPRGVTFVPDFVFGSTAKSIAVGVLAPIPTEDAFIAARLRDIEAGPNRGIAPIFEDPVGLDGLFARRAVFLAADRAVVVEIRSYERDDLQQLGDAARGLLIAPPQMIEFSEANDIDNGELPKSPDGA